MKFIISFRRKSITGRVLFKAAGDFSINLLFIKNPFFSRRQSGYFTYFIEKSF